MSRQNEQVSLDNDAKGINLKVAGEPAEILRALSKKRRKSMTSIAISAIRFEAWMDEVYDSGGKIKVERRDGKDREVVIIDA